MLFAANLVSEAIRSAPTVEVGILPHGYTNTNIQAGSNRRPAGAIVLFCPGEYPEQVLINKGSLSRE